MGSWGGRRGRPAATTARWSFVRGRMGGRGVDDPHSHTSTPLGSASYACKRRVGSRFVWGVAETDKKTGRYGCLGHLAVSDVETEEGDDE